MSVLRSIGDFFVYLWNDDERWLAIAGLLIVFILICTLIIRLIILFGGGESSRSSSNRSNRRVSSAGHTATVTIKGVYQMNGPKPFTRTFEISQSEKGYYSQLMTNKSLQAEWIAANFPGASTARGFSMTVNIN